jgi:hypothetical protein
VTPPPAAGRPRDRARRPLAPHRIPGSAVGAGGLSLVLRPWSRRAATVNGPGRRDDRPPVNRRDGFVQHSAPAVRREVIVARVDVRLYPGRDAVGPLLRAPLHVSTFPRVESEHHRGRCPNARSKPPEDDDTVKVVYRVDLSRGESDALKRLQYLPAPTPAVSSSEDDAFSIAESPRDRMRSDLHRREQRPPTPLTRPAKTKAAPAICRGGFHLAS